MALIDQRNECRRSGAGEKEQVINRQIRLSAKTDKREWLDRELVGGSWGAVKQLRRKKVVRHASVRNQSGLLVDTAQRPEALAEYFAEVQWQVRFANLSPEKEDVIHAELPISIDMFTLKELQRVLKKLKMGKASGHDDVVPEFWKVLSLSPAAADELLGLCNHCWSKKSIPESWRLAKVVLLFKKGDAALPANYRPISLLPVGYKVLAALVHQRLVDGGADAYIRSSQYGFRPGRSTAEALMVARRMIDAAHLSKSDGLLFVLLDWAKAFDRVRIDSMMKALARFGLPAGMVEMVQGIYASRRFFIHDHAGASSTYDQSSGIAQGCPLSPFLFILVQSVMLHDIDLRLEASLAVEPKYVVTRDILYADDTLLASSSASSLQSLLNAVVEEGARYGLELNWDKTMQMQISTSAQIHQPCGKPLKCVREAIYLGGLISCDGKSSRELSRRIGEGRCLFNMLCKIWSHAGISRHRKLYIYSSCVISKVLYSLDSVWLLKADRTRLDAFNCACIRRICGIPHSYVSRVSNDDVLQHSGQPRLSSILAARQVRLYKRIAALPDTSLVKSVICTGDGQPIIWSLQRRRGRPRQMWATQVFKMSQQVAE